MASNHEDSPFDDSLGSLADSYDFVDDRSTSDEEEVSGAMTQSASSNDELDVYQQDLQRTSVECPTEDTPENQSGTTPIPASFNQDESLGSESHFTIREVSRERDGSHGSFFDYVQYQESAIKMWEPSNNLDIESIERFHTLEVFRGPEALGMFPSAQEAKEVAIEVRQTMAAQGFRPEAPYKILYVGDTAAKTSIVNKLGAALAATSMTGEHRTSKFSIVPISCFGDTTPPEVMVVDSIGLELSVEECSSASFTRREGGNDTIYLALSDGTFVASSWDGSRFSVQETWKFPDVAVFYISKDDTIAARQIRRFAQSFMNRHSVPTILISKSRLFDSPPNNFLLNTKTPHLEVKSCYSAADRNRVINRLPIDLLTFLNLDTSQMNRNLAYLTSPHRSLRSRGQCGIPWETDNVKASEAGNEDHQYYGYLNKTSRLYFENLRPLKGFLLPGLLILFFTLLFLLRFPSASRVPVLFEIMAITTKATVSSGSSLSKVVSTVAVSPQTFSSATTGPAPSTSTTPILMPGIISTVHENTDLTSYITSFLHESQALTPSNSEKFKVHVIGDRHVVLRPPHWFAYSKKAPKLHFNVTRKDLTLEHEISTLFDGVYALKLRRTDSHGMLNVSIWTTSKPKIYESFQVDFGTSCWKAAGWKRAVNVMMDSVQEDVGSLHTSLVNAPHYANKKLQTCVQKSVKKIGWFGKGAGKIGIATLDQTTKTADLVIAQTKDLTRSLPSQLERQRATLSDHVSLGARQVRKQLAFLATTKMFLIAQQTRQLSLLASGIDIVALTEEFGELRRNHLRETQKRVLKVWWKIKGLPELEFAESGVKGVNLHMCNTSAKRKGSR